MTTPAPFDHSIAVVIGINAYGNGVPELRTAANDAKQMGDLLGASHGYDVIALLDGDATQAKITELLGTTLPARVGQNDRVLFYFAGHGVAKESDKGPNGYLLPADARRGDSTTYLSMPLVHDALLALSCRHMLVVLDACFSGAFRWSATRDVIEEEMDVVHQEKYDRFVHDPAWQVIASASQDQKAIDQLSEGALGNRDGEGDHSPFARALFDAIGGAGDVIPAGIGDGLVTATELYLYLDETLQNAVIEAGKRQTPRLWPLSKHDKGEFVFFVPGRNLTLPPAPPLTFENNPWMGLTSYDAANAPLFFGRDAEIASLRAQIAGRPLTVVLGASGTGKSSLVKAGVVPKLVADGWHVLPIMRPGTSPLVALAQAVTAPGAPSIAATPDAIAARIAALLSEHPGKKVLLVIDQLEELITLARSASERQATLALLGSLTSEHAEALRVVVTIRTDFEPNFDRAGFGERWKEGRYVIPPMSRENLRAVIEKPANVRVLYFDPSNLIDKLLDEVVATPGALPLLSFALSEMYISYVKRKSGDRAITRADFDGIGGVVGALRSRAEEEYAAFDDAHQATLRRVMLRLVTAEGGALARRRVTDAELDFADDAERGRASTVVKRLTDARLLVTGKEPDGESFVEPAHDALVRGWGQLVQWVREEGEATFPLAMQQRMARAALEWDRADTVTKVGMVWSDSARAAQLTPLVRERAPWLNKREMAFAQRSIRGRLVARITTAAAVLTIGIAGVAAIVGGRRASARAEQVRVGAVVRTASSLVTDDPMLAGLLVGSLDSTMVRDADDATRLAMLGVATQLRALPRVVTTFGTVGDAMSAAEISRDGSRLVTATSGDSAVRVWRTDGRGTPMVLRGAPGNIVAVTSSNDNALVAAGGEEGWVRVWRSDGTVPPQQGSRHPGLRVRRLEFSPDATLLLIVYDEGQSELLDLTAPGPPGAVPATGITATFGLDASQLLSDTSNTLVATPGNMRQLTVVLTRPGAVLATTAPRAFPVRGAILAVAVSPARDRVAIGTEGAVVVYSLLAHQAPMILRGADRGSLEFTSVSWSADGSEIAGVSRAPVATIWDARTGEVLHELRRNDAAMDRVLFSPDMARVVTMSDAEFAPDLWEIPGYERTRVAGHTQQLLTVGFVRDSDHLITASWDGGARLWELPAGRLRIPEDMRMVSAAVFSPDSRHLALGTEHGTVWLYTPDSSPDGRRLADLDVAVKQLAFGADGAALHAVGGNGERATWTLADAGTGRSVVPDSLLPDHPQVQRVLAANGSIGGVHLYDDRFFLFDLAGRQPPRELNTGQHGVFCAALSDDGTRAATCGTDSTVVIARTDGSGLIRTIRHTGGARPGAVSLAHEGSAIAIGYEDGRVRLLTGASTDTGVILPGHRQRIRQLSFSRGTGLLLSTSDDGSIRIWDLRTRRTLNVIRPRGIVVGETTFLPDGRRLITQGVGERDVRVWNVDGTGNAVAFPVREGYVGSMAVSPDGRWLFVGDNVKGFGLSPLNPQEAISAFRSGATCLTPAERIRYLIASEKDAAARSAACQARRAANAGR